MENYFTNGKTQEFNDPMNEPGYSNVARLHFDLFSFPGVPPSRLWHGTENFALRDNNGFYCNCPGGANNASCDVFFKVNFYKVFIDWMDKMKVREVHLIVNPQGFDAGMLWCVEYAYQHFDKVFIQPGQETNLPGYVTNGCCPICGDDNAGKMRDSTNRIFSLLHNLCPKAILIGDYDTRRLRSDRDNDKSPFNAALAQVKLASGFRMYINGENYLMQYDANVSPASYVDSVNIGVNKRFPAQLRRMKAKTGRGAAITSYSSDNAGSPIARTVVQLYFLQSLTNRVLMEYGADTTSIVMNVLWRLDPLQVRTAKASTNSQYILTMWYGDHFEGARTIYELSGDYSGQNAGVTVKGDRHGTITMSNMTASTVPVSGVSVDGHVMPVSEILNFHPSSGYVNARDLVIDKTTNKLLPWSVVKITF